MAFNSKWNWQNFALGIAAGIDTDMESNLAGAGGRDTARENKRKQYTKLEILKMKRIFVFKAFKYLYFYPQFPK